MIVAFPMLTLHQETLKLVMHGMTEYFLLMERAQKVGGHYR